MGPHDPWFGRLQPGRGSKESIREEDEEDGVETDGGYAYGVVEVDGTDCVFLPNAKLPRKFFANVGAVVKKRHDTGAHSMRFGGCGEGVACGMEKFAWGFGTWEKNAARRLFLRCNVNVTQGATHRYKFLSCLCERHTGGDAQVIIL